MQSDLAGHPGQRGRPGAAWPGSAVRDRRWPGGGARP